MKTETIFGIHAVQSLLTSAPQRICELLVVKDRQDQRVKKLLAAAQNYQIKPRFVDKRELDDLCNGSHQGVVALAQPGKQYDEKDLLDLIDNTETDPLILVLDGVTDPHNLGACMRSADAAGVHAVVVPKDNSASLNEAARKVASGAAETVPLVVVTNLARALKNMQEKGLWVAGAAGEAKADIYHTNLTGPRVIVMGAEGEGMRRLTKEICDDLVKIPMAGSVSSLNVSVATGVVLFEVVRQRSA
ncbi:23S rRNA (guanosine(2251)-2'-O)-methyltransferase RlmB [Teredinibacter haidensis]|mgnify:CR=1 FL=1|uniref:23S rRNA (guanosine(2251)-2'-O)-methyltransferase RlmB n=1 Tax=Teredinibacter haidensis TaxID=2731755 RepID=UPI000948F373|nr:23S rRNA (guanosine(2251)-2'-O)-methyltransferase RlmB [Teredinibacter haidensis]